jgi:hypothetical protein
MNSVYNKNLLSVFKVYYYKYWYFSHKKLWNAFKYDKKVLKIWFKLKKGT